MTTSAPGSASYNASFTVATTACAGLPVAIATTGVCTGGGTGSAVVTMTSGTCAVTFNQAGDASYLAAPQKTQATAARKAVQSIAVTTSAPPTAAFGASFPVAATASSGLSVAITATGACSAGGGPGSATVTMAAHTGAAPMNA